jgi:hypothetical protein
MAGELAQGDSASGTRSDRLVRARGGLISRQNCMQGSIEIDASRGGKTPGSEPDVHSPQRRPLARELIVHDVAGLGVRPNPTGEPGEGGGLCKPTSIEHV